MPFIAVPVAPSDESDFPYALEDQEDLPDGVDFFDEPHTPPPGTIIPPPDPDARALVRMNLPHMSYEYELNEWESDVALKQRSSFERGIRGSARADVSRNTWAWDETGRLMYIDHSVEIVYASWLAKLARPSPGAVQAAQPSPYPHSMNRRFFCGFEPALERFNARSHSM